MQRPPATVVVLGTGGTISGTAASPDDNVGYVAGTVGVDVLVAAAPGPSGVRVESEQIAQLDSKDMDFATWRRLAERVAHHAARPEVSGLVVTHGTDTLEETAYFLARVVALAKPVVLTGAMRPASSREADGPRNLADAIAVAADAGRAGVVVAFAGALHSAREVRKVHSSRLEAFASAEKQVAPELLGDGLCAGTVDEVVAEVAPLMAAGLKHVVMWNVGPLVTGGGPADMVRQTQLIWKLKKLQTRPLA